VSESADQDKAVCPARFRAEGPPVATYRCHKTIGHEYLHVAWTDDGDDIVWGEPGRDRSS
jgi:hypothetical protein